MREQERRRVAPQKKDGQEYTSGEASDQLEKDQKRQETQREAGELAVKSETIVEQIDELLDEVDQALADALGTLSAEQFIARNVQQGGE